MSNEDQREAGQVIGVIIVAALAIVVFLCLQYSLSLGFGLLGWFLWIVGGTVGAVTAKALIPVYMGCSCSECRAGAGGIIAGFVFWPIAIPSLILVAVGAALIRGVLA